MRSFSIILLTAGSQASKKGNPINPLDSYYGGLKFENADYSEKVTKDSDGNITAQEQLTVSDLDLANGGTLDFFTQAQQIYGAREAEKDNFGYAKVKQQARGGVVAEIDVKGLIPGEEYVAHLHNKSCAEDGGGHYIDSGARCMTNAGCETIDGKPKVTLGYLETSAKYALTESKGEVKNVNSVHFRFKAGRGGKKSQKVTVPGMGLEDGDDKHYSIVIHDTPRAKYLKDVTGAGPKMLCADIDVRFKSKEE